MAKEKKMTKEKNKQKQSNQKEIFKNNYCQKFSKNHSNLLLDFLLMHPHSTPQFYAHRSPITLIS
jgi:hypothetical protein